MNHDYLKLAVGDVITIKKSGLHVVTMFRTNVSKDELRGDCYYVDEFEVLPAGKTSGNSEDIKKFYFVDGSMRGFGRGITRPDVEVIGKAKVTKEVVTTYKVTNVRVK